MCDTRDTLFEGWLHNNEYKQMSQELILASMPNVDECHISLFCKPNNGHKGVYFDLNSVFAKTHARVRSMKGAHRKSQFLKTLHSSIGRNIEAYFGSVFLCRVVLVL